MAVYLLLEGKWLMCSLQALIQSRSVTTRHLSVRAFGGIFNPGVSFTIFIEYKLMLRVSLLKAAELSWEVELFFCHMYSLCCVGYVDSRELETRGSQAACVVHRKRCNSVIYSVGPNFRLESTTGLLH